MITKSIFCINCWSRFKSLTLQKCPVGFPSIFELGCGGGGGGAATSGVGEGGSFTCGKGEGGLASFTEIIWI